MIQEDFDVEQFMNKYETGIEYNLGETCVDSMSIKDIIEFFSEEEQDSIEKQLHDEVFNMKLVYGWIEGSDELKGNIAKIYNEDNESDTKVTKENIIITNGAIGGNFLSFYTLINPGDKVIAVEPSYQQLTSVPNVFSQGNLIKFPVLDSEGYKPDLDKLKLLVLQNKPKLLIINNPNNPTGYLWNNQQISEIIEICKQHDVYIMCDEVYRPLYHSSTNPPTSIVNFGYEKTLSTGSMSKAFSFAGLRLGWIVSHDKDLIKDLASKRDYNTISISMIDDKFSSFILTHYKKILARNYVICQDNLKLIDKFIEESNGLISWIRPIAGTTGFIKFNKDLITMDLSIELAENHKVLMVPGECFQYPGYARIGFGNSTKDIKGGLEILKNVLINRGLWN